MHRISNPASHLQRRAHKSKKTNEQSPSTDIILKRAHLAVTHPKAEENGGQVGPAEPLFWPNQDGIPAPSALDGMSPPPSQRRLSTFPRLSQPETDHFTLYKGLHTHSQDINSLSFSYTRRKSSSSAPLVSTVSSVRLRILSMNVKKYQQAFPASLPGNGCCSYL